MKGLVVLVGLRFQRDERRSVGAGKRRQYPLHNLRLGIEIATGRLRCRAAGDADRGGLEVEPGSAGRVKRLGERNGIFEDAEQGPAHEIGPCPGREIFEAGEDAQGLAVSLEAARVAHAIIERDFLATPEGRMPRSWVIPATWIRL